MAYVLIDMDDGYNAFFHWSDLHPVAAPASGGVAPAIALTDDALKHLNKMRSERSEDLCLRIGVKQGGCSGMSYTMEFESRENARPDDTVMEYNGFVIGMLFVSNFFCNCWWFQFVGISTNPMDPWR